MSPEKRKEILRVLEKIREAVDPAIRDVLNLNTSRKFRGLINYQMEAGGKRLRPAFLFASCRLLGGQIKDAVYPAAGIEILHNYTLIIDDIIDNSRMRRGKPTVWKNFGKDIAECVGVSYTASIFQAASISKNPLIVSKIFADAMKSIVEGEILDILYERHGRKNEHYIVKNRYETITKADYLKMIKKKTAILFEASCRIGGICAGASNKETGLLGDYGLNMGMAFQIKDDILDIFGTEKKLGKEIGKDIIERKGGNIIILLAMEELNKKDRGKILKVFKKGKILKKDVEIAVDLIGKTKSRKRSERMASLYIKKAKSSLEKLPKNKWNKILDSFADFIVEREK